MEYNTLESLLQKSLVDTDLLTIETTVASGLESVAEGECREIFGKTTPALSERGRVYFNIQREMLDKVFLMRSIDNVYIIVYEKKCNFQFEKKEDMSLLLNCFSEIEWKKPISVWKEVYQYSGNVYPTKEEYETNKKLYDALNYSNPKKCRIAKEKTIASCNKNEENAESKADDEKLVEEPQDYISQDNKNAGEVENGVRSILTSDDGAPAEMKILIPKFRVSSKRVGTHSFSSEDIAKAYGALVQEGFLWIVDLTEFDMEVIANLTESDFIISISLTKSSLHRRNLTAFGWTSLRATICYGLIKLALPQPGEIVVDPLAGSGSIPLEGAAVFPKSYFLAGDIQPAACDLSKKNFNNFNASKELPLNVLRWDAAKLPLRDSSVDVIVTDMPFGKRSGSKSSNNALYPRALREFARVLRKGSGRVVVLTADRRNLEMAYHRTKQLWNLAERRLVNVGGLKALVFLLRRTLFE